MRQQRQFSPYSEARPRHVDRVGASRGETVYFVFLLLFSESEKEKYAHLLCGKVHYYLPHQSGRIYLAFMCGERRHGKPIFSGCFGGDTVEKASTGPAPGAYTVPGGAEGEAIFFAASAGSRMPARPKASR